MKKKISETKKFRAELVRVMPGYKWTVQRKFCDDLLFATGTMSAGRARISTLKVCRRDKKGVIDYSAKSSGYGKNSPWLHECTRKTLEQTLRSLQEHYEIKASNYSSHAQELKNGRLNTITAKTCQIVPLEGKGEIIC